MVTTVWERYRSMCRQLARLDVAESELEAREIVAFAAGLDARRMTDWKITPLSAEAARRADALLRRRQAGEPLAYLLGEWDFYGYTFAVTPDVLIPRSDTEWLCDAAVREAKARSAPRVLDLCCGSGCIGISLALAVPQAAVTAVDCSESAIAVTRRNAQRYALAAPRFLAACGDARAPDSIAGVFDIVVSNPPYITEQEMRALDRSVAQYEPHMALFGGADGLDFYRAMARRPAFALAAGGRIFLECGWKQGNAVAQLFRAAGWRDVQLQCDLAGIPRIVCAEK